MVNTLHIIRDDGQAANPGYVQLYFGATPGIFSAPWILDFTTCGVEKQYCQYAFTVWRAVN